MHIFDGLCFCLDGFPLKQKQHIQDNIKTLGGTLAYAISKKVTYFVIPEGYSNSYKIDSCVNSGIAVVVDGFVNDCIDSRFLQSPESYYPKEYSSKIVNGAKATKANTNSSTQTKPKFEYPNKPKISANGKSSINGYTTSTSTSFNSTRNGTTSTQNSYSNGFSSKPSTSLLSTQFTSLPSKAPAFPTSYFKTTTLKPLVPASTPTTATSLASSKANGTSNNTTANGKSHSTVNKPPKVESDEEEDMGFLFADYFADDGPTPKPIDTSKQKGKAPVPPAEEDEDEELFTLFDDIDTPAPPKKQAYVLEEEYTPVTSDFFSLFDDESAPADVYSAPTIPQPETDSFMDIDDSPNSTYPFYEETTKEDNPKKAQRINRMAYLCTVSSRRSTVFPTNHFHSDLEDYLHTYELSATPKFKPQQEPEEVTNSLMSITSMADYKKISFEELRLLQGSYKITPADQLLAPEEEDILKIPETTTFGGVWTWGWSKYGQMGRGAHDTEHHRPTFTRIPTESEEIDLEVEDSASQSKYVRQIACGFAHTAVVGELGEAVSWGAQYHDNYGHLECKPKRIPTLLETLSDFTVAFVSCGQAHTAFLTDNGQLWTVGSGLQGQLGHGSFYGESVPRLVEEFKHKSVAMVVCGGHSTAAVVTGQGGQGQLYTWGHNDCGQLGYDSPPTGNSIPTVVPALTSETICHVAVGEKHMIASDIGGAVWSWGSNYYSQLGRSGWNSHVPEKLTWSQGTNRLGRTIMLACGKHHSVALVVTNSEGHTEVYTWGRGDKGALGVTYPPPISSVTPMKVEWTDTRLLKSAVQIACGAHHTAAVTKRGDLLLWGDNSHGQISPDWTEIAYMPICIYSFARVTQVACGGYHTCALVSSDEDLILQHSRDGNHDQVRNLLSKNPSLISSVDRATGFNPLHYACKFNRANVVELLLAKGADVNAQSGTNNYTPLHICAQFNSRQCANVLIRTPHISLDPADSLGLTPLHLAVQHPNEGLVDVLVPAGCDKRAVDANGYTALHLAVRAGNYRVARYLVRKAAPITIHDLAGKTPLQYCTGAMGQELKDIAQKHDVFISYAHTDMQFARKLRMELERNCIKCWMDDQRLEAGSDWRADIGNGILAARIIVFIGSPTSIVSDWCLKELRMGEKQGKIIWPIWYQKTEVPTSVSVLFSSARFIDLSTDSLYLSNVPHLVQKLNTGIMKLDRFELLGRSIPGTKTFHKIASKTFSYLAYLPEDDYLGTTLKQLFTTSGILCVDDSMFASSGKAGGSTSHRPHAATPATETEAGHEEIAEVVDVNQQFWKEAKKDEEETFVVNEGLQKSSVFVLVISRVLLNNDEKKNKKILSQLKYAEESNKPIVLITKDVAQIAEDEYGHLLKHPIFQFSTKDMMNMTSEEMYDNLKRVVYVIELLYKEAVLAEKVRQIEEAKRNEELRIIEEKAKMLADARRARKMNLFV